MTTDSESSWKTEHAMFWIQPLDVWNKQTRTLNMDESANIYINKNIVIKSFERWLYARISSRVAEVEQKPTDSVQIGRFVACHAIH